MPTTLREHVQNQRHDHFTPDRPTQPRHADVARIAASSVVDQAFVLLRGMYGYRPEFEAARDLARSTIAAAEPRVDMPETVGAAATLLLFSEDLLQDLGVNSDPLIEALASGGGEALHRDLPELLLAQGWDGERPPEEQEQQLDGDDDADTLPPSSGPEPDEDALEVAGRLRETLREFEDLPEEVEQVMSDAMETIERLAGTPSEEEG